MITVLDIPLSPYAQKVKLSLLEKGIAFETRVPNVLEPDAEFRAQSPRLEVPALIDGDFAIFDSSVIVEYVEERWPEPALLPATPRERARVRMLEEVCDTAYDAVNWGMAEISVFRRAEGATAERILQKAREQVARLNARIERDFEGRPWLNGERFGFGDIAAYPFVNGAASMGCKPAPGSRLEAWLKAMRGRPSAERVKQDIVATLADFMQRPAQIAAGQHRREYRDHRLDWMLRSGGLEIVLDGIAKKNIRFSEEL
ncbi:MAG: glutathione S-transferase family protein [Polyangiales bacterium]